MFEFRSWDLEQHVGVDPTDGFGLSIKVYTHNNKIVQIEPAIEVFNSISMVWLTDKSRYFFDSIFKKSREIINVIQVEAASFRNIFASLIQSLYAYDYLKKHQSKKNYLTIVFSNLGLESISMLNIICQRYSFIKLKKMEKSNLENNLEVDFKLNSKLNKAKMAYSTLCLLISTNTRYEGNYLNTNLRQRFLKGNFKCLSIGSIINLTFPASFIGSSINVLKFISEGTHLLCQNFRYSTSPSVILNHELFKRNDINSILKITKNLKHSILNGLTWSGLNTLAPSLNEMNSQTINKFMPITAKDFNEFSLLYLVNISPVIIPEFTKVVNSKLLYGMENNIEWKAQANYKTIIDQNTQQTNNLDIFFSLKKLIKIENFKYLSSSNVFENEETFINTEGLIKRTNKIIFRQKKRSNWQILRQLLKKIKLIGSFLNLKDNELISFNSKKIANFKNFIQLNYFAARNLTTTSFYLFTKTNSFFLNLKNYPVTIFKMACSKMIYWLNDFFIGSKDEYSYYSGIMNKCSFYSRTTNTNFF